MRMLTSWSRTLAAVSRTLRIAALRVRKKSVSRGLARFLEATAVGFSGEVRRHVRRIAPKPLQPVKAADILGEDMHDEIAEVEQHPAARRRSLDQQRFHVQL